MTQYILVENRTTILLGPIPWKQRFIQSEFDELEIPFLVPPSNEVGYINVDKELGGDSKTNLEIFPVAEAIVPETYDPNYEELVGPFYEYTDTYVKLSYKTRQVNIDVIKSRYKEAISAARYEGENYGTVINIQGSNVFLDTSRDNRNTFVQKYSMMGEGDKAAWKFKDGWVDLSKEELGTLIFTGMQYIQSQFDWEREMYNNVDIAKSVDELKLMDLTAPGKK